MKIALSGAGLRSANVLNTLLEIMPEAELVGYYDPQPTFLHKLPEMPGFASVGEMLAETRPDLFFVGSPNEFHLAQIREGLEAGVPRIFTEKPVVVSIAETMELAALLAEHGPERVMVGLVLRYSQHMADLRAAMAECVLGDVVSLEANEHIGPYHGAFFMRDWRRKTGHSGGFMLGEMLPRSGPLQHDQRAPGPPGWRASAGGNPSCPPMRPSSNEEAEIFPRQEKASGTRPTIPFRSDGDIIDWQTALLS